MNPWEHRSLCTAIWVELKQKKNIFSTLPLILRGRSGPRARPGAGHWARRRTLLSWFRATVAFLWRWRAGRGFISLLLFPVLNRGSWAAPGLLVCRHLLWATSRIPLRLYFRAALWAGLRLPLSRAGTRFARRWTGFGLLGSRAGSVGARTRFPFSGLGAGVMSPLVAARARSIRIKEKHFRVCKLCR